MSQFENLKNGGALRDKSQQFVDIRQQIHAYPELNGEVADTAALVAGLLRGWGYEVHSGIGGHGLVGVLRNGQGDRRLGVRADMDALPIQERTGLPYASQVDGHMHACGHDGHTAILLAAAEHIARTRNFSGTLHLIFQPDEEGLCGAKQMMEDGLFERFPCDAVYALHNIPGLPVGEAVVAAGPVMASSDKVTIRIVGRGGHAAVPSLAIDPMPIAAGIIQALQTIVARNLVPGEPAVVTVAMLRAGATYNVIPESAELVLSVRAFSPDTRKMIEKRIREIVAGQCASFGASAEIDYQHLVPVVLNSQAESELLHTAVSAVLGTDKVMSRAPIKAMGSEDFAWMLEKVPGCYYGLGNGAVGEWGGCAVHNDHYDFNDALIPLGAAAWVALVEMYLRD